MPDYQRTVAHSQPFSVNDRDEFLQAIDAVPDLSVSEEDVDGAPMVRVWSETGTLPPNEQLAELVSPYLPSTETAIFQRTSIHGKQHSGMEMIGINSQGDFLERHSGEMATLLRGEIAERWPVTTSPADELAPELLVEPDDVVIPGGLDPIEEPEIEN